MEPSLSVTNKQTNLFTHKLTNIRTTSTAAAAVSAAAAAAAGEFAPYVQIYTSLFAAKSKRVVLKTTIKINTNTNTNLQGQWRREGFCRPGAKVRGAAPPTGITPILSALNKFKMNTNLR